MTICSNISMEKPALFLHSKALLPTFALICSPPFSLLFSLNTTLIYCKGTNQLQPTATYSELPPPVGLAPPGQPQGERMLQTHGTEQAPCQQSLEAAGLSCRVQIKVFTEKTEKVGLVWILGKRVISRSFHPNHHFKGWVHIPSRENTAHAEPETPHRYTKALWSGINAGTITYMFDFMDNLQWVK